MPARRSSALLSLLLAQVVASQECRQPGGTAAACSSEGNALLQQKTHVSLTAASVVEEQQRSGNGGCECWCAPVTQPWGTKCSWSGCSGCSQCSDALPVPLPTPAPSPSESPRPRTRADDARFLLQATFGPTQEDLAGLSERSYSDWISEQMQLPVGSHRKYFRERVNPHSSEVVLESGRFQEWPVCATGSRWHRHAFTRADVKESWRLEVVGHGVTLDGKLRTDIDAGFTNNGLSPPDTCTDNPPADYEKKGMACTNKVEKIPNRCKYESEWLASKLCQQTCWDAGNPYDGDDCSGGWKSIAGFSGFLCSVEEFVGGLVALSKQKSCSGQFTFMRNPGIWLSSPDSKATSTDLSFEESKEMPGVIFLAEDAPSCELGSKQFTQHRGEFYMYDPRLQLGDNTCHLPVDEGYSGFFAAKACGSPFEVQNEPTRGHQLPARLADTAEEDEDTLLDSRHAGNVKSTTLPFSLSKATVWTAKALEGEDQLRQRMAWALSQIFVVSTEGTDHDRWSEMWLNFYDIFVRHAFGNFKDILREVTYSPVMGQYLTFQRSRSYDSSGSFADENYAREIMQLFSIGLAQLTLDGRVQVDQNGMEMQTYSNEDIMGFARVFTGFEFAQARPNIELSKGGNYVDPMDMVPRYHDVFPKPDLRGGYLGDGVPLCSSIPQRAFLMAGARFEFRDSDLSDGAVELDSGSPLRQALCGGAGSDCTFVVARTLESSVDCLGAECQLEVARFFKVGDGFYEYMPPPCVHPFLFSGRLIADDEKFHKQICAQTYGKLAVPSCCNNGCTNIPRTTMTKKGYTCENHNVTWLNNDGSAKMLSDKCKHDSKFRKDKVCQLSCWEGGAGYDGDDCSTGPYAEELRCDMPIDFHSADDYCASVGMGICPKETKECGEPDVLVWTPMPCGNSVRVHADGKVSAHTDNHEQNAFRVSWCGEVPPPEGDYDATVEETVVFTAMPTKPEALAALKIGVFRVPEGLQCAEPCSGAVKAWGATSALDADTVFEVDGRFYKNVQSLVHVGSGSFRNPPVFVAPGEIRPEGRDLELAVIAEVETLLEHHLRHSNTPVFIGRKLIQRFVTSNPSPAYVEAVADAFATGSHGGVEYSGEYGDLAATVAAILLHPEARSADTNTAGLLREPMLKLMHLMRSMEYADAQGQLPVLRKLDGIIGQFPYRSPTVFNFFDAMYQPPSFSGRMSGPEPEPEPEPEPLVAPEFQIFTPPFAVGFLNGMFSLLELGVSECDSGFGNRGSGTQCEQGHLTFNLEASATTEHVVEELDVLLTGGRLTPANLDVVKAAYEGSGMVGAQQAIALTPEFQTLGAPNPDGIRPEEEGPGSSTPAGSVGDYKALVMLFMQGGADTYNLLVPINCNLYDEYKEVRRDVALSQQELLPITTPGQACSTFGVHPALPVVQDMYSKGQAAFISSIGALVEPTTRATWQSKEAVRCLGMFSHSHQQNAAQTLQCQVPGIAQRGVGGRMADALASQGRRVASFSVSGVSAWSGGFNTSTEIIDKNSGAVRFGKYDIWGTSIDQLTQQRYGNVYCEEYAQAFADHVKGSEVLGAVLDQVTLETASSYRTDTGTAKQFHQVSRLIHGRDVRKAERDLFFVAIGGFDTHGGQAERLAVKFQEINYALEDFVAELIAQSIFDNVVIVTHSDFGRTLTSNGHGTDHGWGGNHIVLGGKIKGGKVLNEFIHSYLPYTDHDAGRGRVIPMFPWESIMVPIAKWLGITDAADVFPNLGNFNSTHIIDQADLIKA